MQNERTRLATIIAVLIVLVLYAIVSEIDYREAAGSHLSQPEGR